MRDEDWGRAEEELNRRFAGQEFVVLPAGVQVAGRQYPRLGHGETKCARPLTGLGDSKFPEFFRLGVEERFDYRCHRRPKQLYSSLPQSSQRGDRM